MALGQWFILAGCFLQTLGVLFVAVDLRKTSREFRRYERRPQRIYARGASMTAAASAAGTVTGGRTPTLGDRVAALEARVNALREELDASKRELKEWTRKEVQGALDLSKRAADDRHEAVERVLRGVTVGPVRLRLAGVVALLLGIALTTAGSVIPG